MKKRLKVFHSPDYFADIGGHVMPIRKFQFVRDQLIKRGIVKESDITAPEPITEKDLKRVHTNKYVKAVMTGKPRNLAESQTFKWSPALAKGVCLTNGGCYEAGKYAIQNGGIVANLASGFHHATKENGGGFCTFNGLIVGARKLQAEGLVKKVMVIDCDQHYGNGTRDTTINDNSIYTFSAFSSEFGYNGIDISETSLAVDICGLAGKGKRVDYTVYMKALSNLPEIIDKFKPDLVYYQAGMDPLSSDPMSNSVLTHTDLKERDRYVFDLLKKRGIPAVYVLAGGYTSPVEIVVEGHINTALVALEIMNATIFTDLYKAVARVFKSVKVSVVNFFAKLNGFNPYRRIADLETMAKLNYRDIAKLENRVGELESDNEKLTFEVQGLKGKWSGIEDDLPPDEFEFNMPRSIHSKPLEKYEDIENEFGEGA